MTQHYDLAIVGNGAIGLFSALEIIKSCPNAKIALIGPPNRKNSATVAAGAMYAVYAELEAGSFDIKSNRTIFELAKTAKHYWTELFQKHPNIKTANDTIVYLKKEHSSFEYENFEFVKTFGDEDGVVRTLSKPELYNLRSLGNKEFFETIAIEDEFGFCTSALVEHLESEVQKTSIKIIPCTCDILDHEGDYYKLFTSNCDTIFAERTLICAGAASSSILGNMPKPISIVSGVGTALQIFNHAREADLKNVIRTVNRGGAQCGVHIVPQKNSFYIGAGNYISFYQTNMHRIETIRYLTNCIEQDLFAPPDVYALSGRPLIGARARAIDGLPVLGAFEKLDTLFIASGFNRVGLTLAPSIAKVIAQWFTGNEVIDKPADWNERDWRPDRSLYNYNSERDSVKDFVNSRMANAFEHQLIPDSSSSHEKKLELEAFAIKANEFLRQCFNLSSDFGFHPDMLAPMLNFYQAKPHH